MNRRLPFLCLFVLGTLPVGCRKSTDLGPVARVAEATAIRESLGSESQEASAPAEEELGTGWATLKGRFRFDGTPPQMPPYGVNREHEVCAPDGDVPAQEYLLVDPETKGIANVVVYLRDAPRVHESAQPSSETVVFDQEKCVFLSHVLPVSVGQPIELKNSDDVGHNTNITGQNKFNRIISAHESVVWSAQKQESAPAAVRCNIHPWRLSYLLPRDDRYVAVTGSDGSFEIANLPAGTELEIQVWHENSAGSNGSLVLETPAARDLNWSKKGRFTLRLEPDETHEVEIVVPASAFAGG